MRPPCFNTVFAIPLAGRGNHEDRCVSAYVSRSAFYCGVNVPAETGKMLQSDKRGGDLPRGLLYVQDDSIFFSYSYLRVCSPVEAGEVARIARRRGSDPA